MAGLSRKFPDGIVYNVAAHINCLFKQIEATKHQHQRGFSAPVPFLTFFFFRFVCSVPRGIPQLLAIVVPPKPNADNCIMAAEWRPSSPTAIA